MEVLTSGHPPVCGEWVPDPQWVLETKGSTTPYGYYVSSYLYIHTHILRIKFNL